MARSGSSSFLGVPKIIVLLVVGVGISLTVGACGPSTPHAAGKVRPAAVASGGTGGDAGTDLLSGPGAGNADGGPREQSAPVSAAGTGLPGCGPDGAGGVTGTERDAGIGAGGTGGRAGIDAGETDLAGTDAGAGTDAAGLAGNDAAVPKMVRDAGAGDAAARGPDGEPATSTTADAAASGSTQAAMPAAGDLAIVELLINPMGTDTGREWIEIINRSDHPVSLATLHIADLVNDVVVDFTGSGAAGAGADADTPARTRLDAGGRAVLIQSADPAKNGGVTWPSDAVAGIFGTRVSLNNDADSIALCAGACATGGRLVTLTWDSSLGAEYDGHALVIDDRGRRCAATVTFGDAGSFGTPFAANSACP